MSSAVPLLFIQSLHSVTRVRAKRILRKLDMAVPFNGSTTAAPRTWTITDNRCVLTNPTWQFGNRALAVRDNRNYYRNG